MSPMASLFLFSFLTFLYIARAQDRAPHGLVYENPMAFSPSAFDFFHPDTKQSSTQNSCSNTNCSPLPLAAQVEQAAQEAQETKLPSIPKKSQSRVGAGGIAGIVLGFAFAILSAMGVYYVATTRRANASRANSVQPDA